MTAYRAHALYGMRTRLAYAHSFLLSQVFLVVVLVIFFEFYSIALPAGRSEFGFTLRTIMYYLAVAEAIELSRQRLDVRISSEVKDGSCAYGLLRPGWYIGMRAAEAAGATGISLLASLVIGFGVACVATGIDGSILSGLMLSWPAILLGAAINLEVVSIFGLLAFYFEETAPFTWTYQKLVFILGGMFLPLEFFPAWLRQVSLALPFAYVSWFPAKCVVAFKGEVFAKGLAIQVGWLVGLTLIIVVLESAGRRRLLVNGG